MDLFQTCYLTWWIGLPCFIFDFYCLCVPRNHQTFAFGIFYLLFDFVVFIFSWFGFLLTTTSSLNFSVNLNNDDNVSFLLYVQCIVLSYLNTAINRSKCFITIRGEWVGINMSKWVFTVDQFSVI